MSWKDPNTWHQIGNAMPFVSLATARAGQHVQRPIITRVIEGIIMGAVGGAVGVYVSIKVLENDVRHLRDSVAAIAAQAESGRVENTRRIERLEGLYFRK